MQSRRDFLRALGLSAAYLALNGSLKGADRPAGRPNIILCMADDQGWGEMGYYGHPELKTPVFDEMAAGGVRFDRFYSGAPVCSPTRASVMTGRHPNRSGVFLWNYAIRPEEVTIAQLLKMAGFRRKKPRRTGLLANKKYVRRFGPGGLSFSPDVPRLSEL